MKKALCLALLLTVLCFGLALLPTAAEGETESTIGAPDGIGAPDDIGAPELPVPTIPTDNWLDYAETVAEKDGVYEISKPEQLAWIARELVLLKSDFKGKTIKLMNDIDLSSHLWTPIGHKDMAFAGSFDGQGHTIRGLIITDASEAGTFVGLFGKAASDLKNITISDSYLNVTPSSGSVYSAYAHIGALAGDSSGKITNCHVINTTVIGNAVASSPDLQNSRTSNSFSFAGALVGSASSSVTGCTITNTSVTGSAKSGSGGDFTSSYSRGYTGGLAGDVSSSITDCRVDNTSVDGSAKAGTTSENHTGGLVGYASSVVSIKNCSISSTLVNSSDYSYCHTGGLIGSADASSITIINCNVNEVAITGDAHGDISYTGGLMGSASITSYSAAITIKGCDIDSVTVIGKHSSYKYSYSHVGGLVGYVLDSYSLDISNCNVRHASVIGECFYDNYNTNSYSYAGGLVGYANLYHSLDLTNCCVSDATIKGNGYTGGLLGGSAASVFASKSFVKQASLISSGTMGGLFGQVSSLSALNCGVVNSLFDARWGDSYQCLIGGIVGDVKKGCLENCFAALSLTAETSDYKIGGIAANCGASLYNCYAHLDTAATWYGVAHTSTDSHSNLYYNSTAAADFYSNSGRVFSCKAMTDAEMKAETFVNTLNSYWGDKVNQYWNADDSAVNSGYPILNAPTVTSIEAIGPSERGGSIRLLFHGTGIENIQNASLESTDTTAAIVQPTFSSATLFTASITPAANKWSWSSVTQQYYYSGSVTLIIDELEEHYEFSAYLTPEIALPKVTALSCTNVIAMNGGKLTSC